MPVQHAQGHAQHVCAHDDLDNAGIIGQPRGLGGGLGLGVGQRGDRIPRQQRVDLLLGDRQPREVVFLLDVHRPGPQDSLEAVRIGLSLGGGPHGFKADARPTVRDTLQLEQFGLHRCAQAKGGALFVDGGPRKRN